jgi:hypothetical protein
MAQSKITTDIVIAQVTGMDAEIARIDEQIAQLNARREAVLLMKNTLSPLVAKVPNPPTGLTATVVYGDKLRPAPSATVPGSVNGVQLFRSSTGFRDALRKVLRDHPKGLRPAQVVQELRDRGDLARYTGKAKPQVRVHNELYELKRTLKIFRDRKGRYTLAPEDAPNT